MDFYVFKSLWSNGKTDPNLHSKSGLAEFSITSEVPPFFFFFINTNNNKCFFLISILSCIFRSILKQIIRL